ncbi:MAG: class I SAM-dependent methyltransferase [Acaryochloris sp. RU_4_1]|nr:class I SAM-dependent methyltransferase [Acaryochloris sp. RU_4_1]
MKNALLNVQTATGHQVLAVAGKKILRPGGKTATEQLFQWADFKPGETVLELASSFGESAIALAQRFGVNVVGVEKNPDSVQRARAQIEAAGLGRQITLIEGDIFHLETIPETFDYVLAEAILTLQSPAGKAKILSGVRDRLKPGGKFLSHELLAQAHEEEIHQLLAQTIRANSTPLSETNWISALTAAGLAVQQHQTGPLGLLNIGSMIQDEGLFSTLRILGNIFTQPDLRKRVLGMRRAFHQYRQDLGYIILSATRI